MLSMNRMFVWPALVRTVERATDSPRALGANARAPVATAASKECAGAGSSAIRAHKTARDRPRGFRPTSPLSAPPQKARARLLRAHDALRRRAALRSAPAFDRHSLPVRS